MTVAAPLTEITSLPARCCRDASFGRCRTCVLAPALVKDYHNFFRLPAGDTWPS